MIEASMTGEVKLLIWWHWQGQMRSHSFVGKTDALTRTCNFSTSLFSPNTIRSPRPDFCIDFTVSIADAIAGLHKELGLELEGILSSMAFTAGSVDVVGSCDWWESTVSVLPLSEMCFPVLWMFLDPQELTTSISEICNLRRDMSALVIL